MHPLPPDGQEFFAENFPGCAEGADGDGVTEHQLFVIFIISQTAQGQASRKRIKAFSPKEISG